MNLGFVLLYEDDSPCPPASDNVKAPDALFPPDIAVYTTISPVILGPNITGEIRYSVGVRDENYEGPFSIAFRSGAIEAGTGSGFPQTIVGFDASKCDEHFSIDTVQPDSAYSLIIIKT